MTLPVSVTKKVTLEGNFFKRDPGKTLSNNVTDMLDALAAWMEGEVAGDIESHAGQMPFYTGWSADHTKGYTTSGFTGKHWSTWAAVAAYTAGMGKTDAIRTKASAATIERRFHPYRRVKAGIYRSKPVVAAALAKGIE